MEFVPTFNALRKNTKKEFSFSKKKKIAILGDSSTQFFKIALKGYGIELEVDFEIYEADYDMIEQEVFNLNSQLYDFEAEVIIIIPSVEKLLDKFYKTFGDERENFADLIIGSYSDIYQTINKNTRSKVILFNFASLNNSVFGHYGSKVRSSFVYQLRKVNYELTNLSIDSDNLFLYDLDLLQSRVGYNFRYEAKFHVSSKMVFTLDILPIISKELCDIIFSIDGSKLRKCLILDLDNTMWGGVIGDDGMEGIQIGDLGIGKAFTDLQYWAKELKRRGIILCVCSKNTESIAKEPFEKHPDMVLSLEDISVFVANWENKADNIRHIKEILNIGYDSMVFLDDNPFERNLVRKELPEVFVPELPSDPAEYSSYLRNCNLFETASVSGEDINRTKRYQEEAKRVSVKSSFSSIAGYLENLDMIGSADPFDNFSIPRVAQLTQRSNQFNLRTIRYSETDIKNICESDKHVTLAIKLKDKYGSYGLISTIIGEIQDKELFIDTWIMSCRVLKRDVEKFALNQLVEKSKSYGVDQIVGERIPTPKNVIVQDHYKNLGFIEKNGRWYLDLKDYKALDCFIQNEDKITV